MCSTHGSICTGIVASPNWYGQAGYPPYFTRSTSENCPQKYSLSRCEQSAVMNDGSSNFTKDSFGAEVCTATADCLPTKQNCNDTLVCSDLIQLKDELMEGGHNIVCRHEKTYWSQNTGEKENCHVNNNCLDSEVKVTQRQLHPFGWESAKLFAEAFSEMGIPIGKTYSSPLTRCVEHAQVFSDEPNEELIELMYMAPWEEILELNNITEKIKVNTLKWQAYNLRNFAGKKPPSGKNNIIVTHGFNIKLSFGTAVDEGYCMVLKPEDSEPSLADSIGSLTVGNREFKFDNESFPVDAIARMSPESALLMQTCDDIRSDAIENDDDNLIASIDTDHNMKITQEEFIIAHGASLIQAHDAFDFISSVVIQPELLGKPTTDESASIELGQFYHINWGWREYLKTGGDISYPWRSILENTVGPLGGDSPESRVNAFKQANSVLSHLITALRDDEKYPSKAIMEERLINCDSNDVDSQYIANCSALFIDESGGSAYIPIGPGDGGAATLRGESIFSTPLAYPSQWKPDFHESRLLKVAKCLVSDDFIYISDLLKSMGCASPPTPEPTAAPSDLATSAPSDSPTKSPSLAPSDSRTQSPSSAPSDLRTISPIGITCAAENEKSRKCGRGKQGKDECCPGLVCHKIHQNRCVPSENTRCAIKGTVARKCGAGWAASRRCCGGLVCNFETHKCASPDKRQRWPDIIEDEIISLTFTESPTFAD